MANKYVQYGAVVATGVGAAALTTGYKAYQAQALINNELWKEGAAATTSAMDAGTSAAGSAVSGAITNPAFLTTVGLGLVGLALGSGSKRPSLSFPNLAATAAVALNVAQLIQAGKTAAKSLAQEKAGVNAERVSYGALRVALSDNDPQTFTDKARRARQTYRLSFPDDLSNRYYIKFELSPYERLNKAQRTTQNAGAHTSIRLPIPANLVDSISLAYQDIGLGVFGGAAFENRMDRLNQPAQNGQGEIMRHATAAAGGLADLIDDPGFMQAVARRLASNIDPAVGAAFDLATGTAPNPHMAVSFQGVALKKYQFNWRLSPNNKRESDILHEVVRNLQASALPETRGKFMLTFPDVVEVTMVPKNLFIFKPMMIDNISVNYAPSGSPSFFKGETSSYDRYPTEIELSISLREIDIHTASDADYEKIRDNQKFSQPPQPTP